MTSTPGAQRIAIGADHGGYELKEQLRRWLGEQGYQVEDCGVFASETADYPLIAAKVAELVAGGRCQRGIIIDGAGIGSSMVANKVPGVRAALCYDVSSANNSREHNDANVLTLGARLIGPGLAEQIVRVFLTTACREPRHLRRVALIGDVERRYAATTEGKLSLAQKPRPLEDTAAAPEPEAPVAEFRASAAKRLAMEAPSIDPNSVTDEDLERIATRIFELLGSAPAGAAAHRAARSCGTCASCTGHCASNNPAGVRQLVSLGAGRIANDPGGGVVPADVAGYIDHTLLKPVATLRQIEALCAEARRHGFASVCLNPCWVKAAAACLRGSQVPVCTVVGFPLGACVADIKGLEARRAIRDGAREIDMVINIGALKGGDDETVFKDIRAVVDACEDGRALCKVIIETALLTDDEKVRACVLARRARADFVKTSTGFAAGGATAADVALMAEVVRGARMGVKASGGVKDYQDFKSMVQAGATRIGASAGVRIVKEAEQLSG